MSRPQLANDINMRQSVAIRERLHVQSKWISELAAMLESATALENLDVSVLARVAGHLARAVEGAKRLVNRLHQEESQ